MNTITKVFGTFAVMAALVGSARGQQVDCNVQVNYEAVSTAYKDLLRDFANDVSSYVNNYNWAQASSDVKVKCTLNIFIQSVTSENHYTAQVFIGSQRPIYKSDQNTVVVRLFDEMWEFTYVRTKPLNHNPRTFDDLASFLDFYMYLIIGYDNDTYERGSGTPLFQSASDVASLGRASGQKGWQPNATSFARIQLIDEIQNPAYETLRTALYTYHYCGLDSLAFNRRGALDNIRRAVTSVGILRNNVDPRNQFIRTFFEAKAKELADLFLDYPDPNVYNIFIAADPSHRQAYDEAFQKRK